MPREGLAWVAGLLTSLAVAGLVIGSWLDPRFGYIVDDGFNHALRLGLFDASLRRGALFPRWWPDLALGYGYPLLHYYSPAVYYLGELFHLLGATLYRALQLVAMGTALLGAAGAYVLGAVLFRHPLAAVVVACVYVGAPYPFVTNLYNRAAFPEALGLALLPWLLAAGWVAVQWQRPSPWRALAPMALGLALAALVLAHSLTALIGAALLLPWLAAAAAVLPAPRRRRAALRGAAGVGWGLALSAFFWIPAVFEQGAVHTEMGKGGVLSQERWLFDPLRPTPAAAETGFAEPYRISRGVPFDLHWVYPHATAGVNGPPKLGLAQALYWFGGLLAGGIGWWERRQQRPGEPSGPPAPVAVPWPAVRLCLVLVPLLWLLNTTWSAPLWRFLPWLAVLQFPWRLYGVLALLLAVGGAGFFAWLAGRDQQQWVLALLLAAFVVVNGRYGQDWDERLAQPNVHPAPAARLQEAEESGMGSATTSGGEFLPRSVVLPGAIGPGWGWKAAYESFYPDGGWIAGRVWPFAGRIDVRQVWETPRWTAARVEVGAGAPAELAFHTLVFPGWRAYVDGRPVPLRPAPFDPLAGIGHGFALVGVPPGEHVVQIAAGPTVWRTVGETLSLLASGAGAGYLLWLTAGREARRRRWLGAGAAGVTAAAVAVYLALFALWPLWRAPGRPSPADAVVVLDLAAAVRDGRATRRDAGVDVGEQVAGGHRRTWLAMAPEAEVEVALDVPARAVFQAGLGVDPRRWDAPAPGDVRFSVLATDGGGGRHILLEQDLQPQVRPEDRGWRFALVDLGAFAGQRISLTLRVEGGDPSVSDRAGWATPAVYVDRSGRYPPVGGVAPALRGAGGAQTPP